ncbi:hypothetical protein PR202_gb10256 [Eleusine coracana subsp. coracana]|uniref:CRIB domain-containing protein n=1 Tax=Eleusine coracana subsp. coracana TaxID=191504 RepID=A0AAV5EIU4_ELECO|nr:hypothetical protein PR202_gb10256 [Eleusine coracana subsp. coracana]
MRASGVACDSHAYADAGLLSRGCEVHALCAKLGLEPSTPRPTRRYSCRGEAGKDVAPTRGATPCGLDEGGGEATKEKGIVTAGVQRLMKGIKSLSLMFAVYEDDDEEEEQEMVIGYPTDVQHVGHIGWDGHGGLNKVGAMGMVNAFSLPSSLSFRQLEVAMDQAAHA